MSHNIGADSAPPSRRSVVKGAAWAVPAVVVAGAAPTVAASSGPLAFTGGACKLPGNSTDILKGYVFELTAVNSPGPQPTTGITVITNVRINGTLVSGFSASVRSGNSCSGSCATLTCGADPDHVFCTPDATTQQVLIYTADKPTGNSQNAEMSLSYQRFDCLNGVTCSPVDLAPVSISSGVRSTDSAPGPNQGSCNVQNIFPIPTGT
ncbi:hypothetical protein ASH01_15875 [Terrabacter sp. Soil811]|uniref:hypothetical protein n=1 Tax=Terrabacter sp. Soil811 TaxID=1736419 RepID=UPI0006F3FA37|nr:hypothetical protein [Terrabacter sp. Soil811]KRF43276.1 hypothetical protein ASH01_15875 [Terrabacter sp. Soil811]